MRTLLYNSIKKRKLSIMFILINLIIAVIIMYDLLHMVNMNNLENNIMSNYVNLDSTILLQYADFNKPLDEMKNDMETISGFLKDKNVSYGGYAYTNYQFKELMDNKKYIELNTYQWKSDPLGVKPMASKLLYVDRDIVNMIPDKSGQIKKLYSSNMEEIPLVLGNSYKDIFSVGQELTDVENVKYKIIGFLDKGSSWISSGAFYREVPKNLDDYFVLPYNTKTDFQAFAITAIGRNYIIEAKDKKESNTISEELTTIAGNKKININPLSTYELLLDSKKSRQQYISYMSAISLVVIVFITVIDSLSMMISIDERKYDISVMITQGASNKFLACYVFIENLIIFLASLILGFAFNFIWKSDKVIFLFAYKSVELKPIIMVSTILLGICMLSVILPIKKILSINPSKLIVE
ncbi:ABC transporter permease [Clostridium folliculivorans]|uniref:ABC3 transporter permease C-terminal domain-containing protein n=1 Tax=Clostridium folliculivorans TaxID=2886038 RepID=A0A9W6DBC6_9CLOT|nr:ABC transporter permease [Clostridium folliculivorans]GKU26280.1 hypothetical protein CFOLD11_31070 [Clostridium folliculivorans]GKU31952.1 hypothetical protein CFB3_40600 [Clostridium folliculivorans]